MTQVPPSSPQIPRLGITPVQADNTRVAAPTPAVQPPLAPAAATALPTDNRVQIGAQGSASASVSLTTEPQFVLHTVQRGETLGKIAQEYLGSTQRHPEIYAANADDLRNPNDLRVGMVLKIPVDVAETSRPPARPPQQPTPLKPAVPVKPPAEAPPLTHTVKRGDSLSNLALQYLGNSERYMEIFEANADIMKTPNALQLGMTLKIPNARVASDRAASGGGSQPVTGPDAADQVDATGLTPGAQELLAALQKYQTTHRELGNTHRARTTPAELREIATELDSASRAFGVDPKMLLAVFAHESEGFNPRARSHTGAGGLGQLTGIAIRQVHHMAGIGKGNAGREPFKQYKNNFVQSTTNINQRFNIKANIWTSAAYMSYEINDRARLGRGVENALKRYGDPSVSTYAQKVNTEHRTLFGSRLF